MSIKEFSGVRSPFQSQRPPGRFQCRVSTQISNFFLNWNLIKRALKQCMWNNNFSEQIFKLTIITSLNRAIITPFAVKYTFQIFRNFLWSISTMDKYNFSLETVYSIIVVARRHDKLPLIVQPGCAQ